MASCPGQAGSTPRDGIATVVWMLFVGQDSGNCSGTIDCALSFCS